MTIELERILKKNDHSHLYGTLVDGLLREHGYMLEQVRESPRHRERWMVTPDGVHTLAGWSDKQYKALHQVGVAKIADYREAIAQWMAQQDGTDDMKDFGAGEGAIFP